MLIFTSLATTVVEIEIEIEIFILLHNQAVTFILYKKNYKIGTAHPA